MQEGKWCVLICCPNFPSFSGESIMTIILNWSRINHWNITGSWITCLNKGSKNETNIKIFWFWLLSPPRRSLLLHDQQAYRGLFLDRGFAKDFGGSAVVNTPSGSAAFKHAPSMRLWWTTPRMQTRLRMKWHAFSPQALFSQGWLKWVMN